jgi:TolA-binding protein
LEVPFRGTGWVYLGEADARRGVSYNTRRADADGQTFVFRLDKSGEYTLLFYKQDFIRDYILNDQVRVIVEDTPAQTSPYAGEPAKLIAEPRWPPPETAAAAGQGGALPGAGPVTRQDDVSGETAATAGQGVALPEAAVAAGQGGATPAAAELRPEALTARAKEAYGAGQFPEALAALDEFQANFPLGSDEAWWLYGQLLEAAGPKRDIRGALEYYRRLIREYPQSPRCDDARKRIAYLERFYFNIR